MHRTIYRSRSPSRPADGPDVPAAHRPPADPTDGDAILQRFTEMMNDFSRGQPGRSGRETLFPADDASLVFGPPGAHHFHRTATFSPPRFPGGAASFTIATGPVPARRGSGGSDFER